MVAATIHAILAREVLDSRGRPTVEVEVVVSTGHRGRASVPSGASTGTHEALELRDGDARRHAGKGVRQAVARVREVLAPLLVGHDVSDQEGIDQLMITADGTDNKSHLGANAILGASLACAHAASASAGVALWQYLERDGRAALPLPMVNMISGGMHAGGHVDFQDFLLMPIGARTYSEALEMSVDVYRSLGDILRKQGLEADLVGDEGGYGPRLQTNEQGVLLLLEAIRGAGLEPGRDAGIALDVAASQFHDEDHYRLKESNGIRMDAGEMVDLLARWVDSYPILSIEDGLAEDDWDGWRHLTMTLGSRVQLVGDDLFVTNPERLGIGIVNQIANAILIKVNQIGTLSETRKVIDLARSAGYRQVISARSGETEDATLADLAVASGSGQIKIGSVVRGERLAKYNQLLRIEEQLDRFAGWKPS